MLRGDEVAVVHRHGYWDEPESVVLGIRSYEAVLGSAAAQALQMVFALDKTILFVGVGDGLEDPNWSALRAFLSSGFSGAEYRHYRLCLESELETLAKAHRQEMIRPLAYGKCHSDLAPFLEGLKPQVPTIATGGGRGSTIVSSLADEVASMVRVAVGVVVSGESVVLVHRRYREHLLEWQFPAGFVNPYRDAKEQLLDEVRAETGLSCKVSEFLGGREHPDTGVLCVYYLLEVLHGDLRNGDTSENLEARWVPTQDLFKYVEEDRVFANVREKLFGGGSPGKLEE